MKIAIIGNCQARPVANLLAAQNQDVEICSIGIVHLLKPHDEESLMASLETADAILAQQVAPNYPVQFVTTQSLKQRFPGRVVSWVNMYFAGYNPEIRYLRGGVGRLPGPMGDYHDDRVLAGWRNGSSVETTVAQMKDVEYNLSRYAKTVETALAELRLREKTTDVSVCGFIEEQFASRQLFHTMNHPAACLLTEMSQRIAHHIGLSSKETPSPQGEPLGQFRAPINPYFGSKFQSSLTGPDQYFVLSGNQPAQNHTQATLCENFFRHYDQNRTFLEQFPNA